MRPLAAALVALAASCAQPEAEPPISIDPCEGVGAVTLKATPTRARVRSAVALWAGGGAGRIELRLEPGGSGGEIRGDRLVTGDVAGTDVVVARDLDCGGEAQVSIEVIPPFSVLPTRGVVKPGTAFTFEVGGTLGEAEFSMAQAGSGGTVDARGRYQAGPAEGVDLIQVRDSGTGEQALLRFDVSAAASLRGDPERLALPSGSSIPLAARDGTDGIVWTMESGPGSVEGGRYVAPPLSSGTAVIAGGDPFTGETARVRVRILDELFRPTRPHGRLSDIASVITADFDGDGVRDVAVGRAESDLAFPSGGAVFVYRGGAAVPEEPTWMIGGPSETALFGSALAAGDLDGDGKAELVVSSPGEDLTFTDSGAVRLYRFDAAGPILWRPPLTSLGRGGFGTSLDVADLDGDGDRDLVVGAPLADLATRGPPFRRGVVEVFLLDGKAPPADLAAIRLGGWDLDPDGSVVARTGVNLGRGVVARDLNGDGRVDLAMLGAVTNSLAGGAPLARSQPGVQIHLSRGGAQPFHARPDAYLVPTNAADTFEGTWRIAFVEPFGTRRPLVALYAEFLDSPDLSAAGGVRSGANAGGALLFDVSSVLASGEPPVLPTQLGLQQAWARFYADAASTGAGRALATADLDGLPGPELVLGAPFAWPMGAGGQSIRLGGKLLAFQLTGVAAGTVANVPYDGAAGATAVDMLGAGLAAWPRADGDSLLAFATRASTIHGDFVGRLDVFHRKQGLLSTWSRSSALVPARAASEQFGAAVAMARTGFQSLALVAAPGRSGPGVNLDGNDLAAGAAFAYDERQPPAPMLLAEGAAAPMIAGGRGLGTAVAFTDFDGDGIRDALVGAPSQQVPGANVRAAEIAPHYVENPACVPATTVTPGGVQVFKGRADGTFAPAYRIWAPPGVSASGMGRELAGGFDFDGDGREDVAVARSSALDVFLGRPPSDASLAKLTMVCDPILAIAPPSGYRFVDRPAGLGDLDGDGCHELGWRYRDTSRGGFAIAFGFDASGARCGGATTARVLRISADVEVGLPFLDLGAAAVHAGAFLGGGRDVVAISSGAFPVDGRTQPAVLLFDAAELAARRPASGEAVIGAIGDGLAVKPLAHRQRLVSFGAALASAGDLTGDGVPELLVGAPDATWASDAGGAVFVFRGGEAPEPWMSLTGDVSERSAFGVGVAFAPGAEGSPPTAVIGAPRSSRRGPSNGTAFRVPLAF